MINTVVGVHGVGARGSTGSSTLGQLSSSVAAVSPGTRVVHCNWGESCGARLLADGDSLPTDGMNEPLVGDGPWSLDDDPLVELRLLATLSGGRGDDNPIRHTLIRRADELPNIPAVSEAFDFAGLAGVLHGAVRVVLNADPTRQALANADELGAELNVALAWAIVATAMVRAGAPGAPVPLDGDRMRVLAELVTEHLGGPPGLGVIGRRLAGLGMAAAGLFTERRRTQLTVGATRYVGDVAKYLRDGAPLRSMIRKAILDAPPPVVVVAHSLGGVACVELLAGDDPPPVHTLITVGSQAPYLFEIDVLSELRFGDRLPKDFPLWINVLDPRDLLAFSASKLFDGHAVDRVVHTGAPFPRAHSAYFGTEGFRAILGEVLR